MRRRVPTDPPRHRLPPPRDPSPRGVSSLLLVVASGLALYLATLWLGVEVIGDTWIRSAIMAALIVAIAAVGYAFNRRPPRPGGR